VSARLEAIQMKTILVRESDRECVFLLRLALNHDGWKIEEAANEAEMRRAVGAKRPDVVLVDVDREGGDSLLGALASSHSVVIAVTMDESDGRAISLMTLGADAIYTRPIAPDLLRARLDAFVRLVAKHNEPEGSVYAFDSLSVNLREPVVSVQGEPLHLSSTEYRLVRILALNAGRIVSHSHLLREVWGDAYEGSHELLRTFMSTLRRRLRDAGIREEIIHTERQLGYWIPRTNSTETSPDIELSGHESRHAAELVRAQSRVARERLGIETRTLLQSTQRLQLTLEGMRIRPAEAS
jgi:two-component system KDP operon response regulator KdpE